MLISTLARRRVTSREGTCWFYNDVYLPAVPIPRCRYVRRDDELRRAARCSRLTLARAPFDLDLDRDERVLPLESYLSYWTFARTLGTMNNRE